MSCNNCSNHTKLHSSRTSSRTRVALPNLSIAARRASSSDIARSMLSWVSIAMWLRISSSRSLIMRSRRFMISRPPLLVLERHHWIDSHGPSRWYKACQGGDSREGNRDGQYGDRIVRRDAEQHVCDQARCRERAWYPYGQAGQRQQQRFAQDHL